MEQVKLLSMTTMLTVLIWAGADSLVNETAMIRVSIELIPPENVSNMLIQIEENMHSFELEVSGPHNAIKKLLSQAPLKMTLAVADRATGKSEIHLEHDTIKRMASTAGHDLHEIVIGSIAPDTIHMTIDHIITQQVTLTVNQSNLTYDVDPQLQHTSATLSMRESVFLARSSDAPMQIDLSQEIDRLFKDQPLGKRVTFPVSLSARTFGPDARVEPNTIEVTAAVETQLVTQQIPTVPILLAVSVANLDKPFRAVARDGNPLSLMTQTISVIGQREDVDRLMRGETRVYGIIQLKQEDFDALGKLKLVTPEYHLPPGIRLAEQPAPVEFKLDNHTESSN